jgi:hypothetical protein
LEKVMLPRAAAPLQDCEPQVQAQSAKAEKELVGVEKGRMAIQSLSWGFTFPKVMMNESELLDLVRGRARGRAGGGRAEGGLSLLEGTEATPSNLRKRRRKEEVGSNAWIQCNGKNKRGVRLDVCDDPWLSQLPRDTAMRLVLLDSFHMNNGWEMRTAVREREGVRS